MADDPPTPPVALPADLVDRLGNFAPEHLQDVARYAEVLSEYKAREGRLEEDTETNEEEAQPEDLPDDVPSKATSTIKEINENRYYWQWRDGDEIKSKYKAPVNPDE